MKILSTLLAFAIFAHVVRAGDTFGENIQLRGSLDNSRLQFERAKKGRVAFIGGSITEMNGYRPMVCEILRARFPETSFDFIDAGIASTCSTTGAARLDADVLSKGPVDLFFIEFAVNDDQDAAHTRAECIRGMEGIVRHALRANPNMDIVITFFVNEGMLKTLQVKQAPLTIEAHDAVAQRYSVSTVNLAKEVAEEISSGALTWKIYGGVHPAKPGNALCAKMIETLFNRAWREALPKTAALKAHELPPPLDEFNYESARFIDPQRAEVKSGWTLGVPDWAKLAGSKRERFTKIPMLCATESGAEVSLPFEGKAIGAYVVAGPDAGIVEARIDGGAPQAVNLFHHFSSGLHYPRTVMFATELNPGKHTLTLKISSETKSGGHAARIMQFVGN
ncbi:MAG TPA: GDSL-type esterase/lipase family protein [Planctomycetota bacterium]|nr:GDSL-type esterase/lipase family protein [Planctomycetota bacterium]